MLAARSAALECFIRFLNSPQASLWLQQVPWPILFEFLGLTYHHVTFGSTYTHSMLAARSTALECFIRFLNSPRASLWLQQVPLAIFIRVSGGHTSSLYIAPRRIAPPQKFFSIFGVPATEISRPNLAADHHPQFIFQFLEFPRAGTPQMFSVIFNSAPARSAAPKILFDFGVLATDISPFFNLAPESIQCSPPPILFFDFWSSRERGMRQMFSVISNPTPASIGPPRRIAPAPKFYYIFGVPAIEFSLPNFLAECPLKLFFNFLKFPRVATLRAEHLTSMRRSAFFFFLSFFLIFGGPASGSIAHNTTHYPLIQRIAACEPHNIPKFQFDFSPSREHSALSTIFPMLSRDPYNFRFNIWRSRELVVLNVRGHCPVVDVAVEFFAFPRASTCHRYLKYCLRHSRTTLMDIRYCRRIDLIFPSKSLHHAFLLNFPASDCWYWLTWCLSTCLTDLTCFCGGFHDSRSVSDISAEIFLFFSLPAHRTVPRLVSPLTPALDHDLPHCLRERRGYGRTTNAFFIAGRDEFPHTIA
ncbi:hypothetical protein K438DRAFT_2009118 [Mycena galopus ATCC 62051]|nr:hypothetical protein K438DRAFT_2009118 [Mycena galopus ATCC 62051]